MAAESHKRIGYFLRHAGNAHYFASIRPYLDYFASVPEVENRVLVTKDGADWRTVPDYAGHIHLFTSDLRPDDCDVVLTPTFLRPEDRPGSRNPLTRVVQIFHGMSDKPFTYERDFRDYALCLCAGQRQADRLMARPHNREIRCRIVGYPKFDHIPPAPRLFDDDRPTLIYCPTWRKGGISSIDRFMAAPEAVARLISRYNLIVKPHPNLLNPDRPFYDRNLVDRLERLPGIRLIRSGNVMPWLAQADLFIGDISAAGYEWLYFNRPMVFLNPQPGRLVPCADIESPTYLWQAGSVCDSVEALIGPIKEALSTDRHVHARETILSYSVHRPRDGAATARAVAAVEALL